MVKDNDSCQNIIGCSSLHRQLFQDVLWGYNLAYRFLSCQRQTAKTATPSDKTCTTITLVIVAVAEYFIGLL